MNRLVKAWRRVVLGERTCEIREIDSLDLSSYDPIHGRNVVFSKSPSEWETTTRRQRRQRGTLWWTP